MYDRTISSDTSKRRGAGEHSWGKKVLAKYEADVLEKYQLTPEEIAWRNAKKKEAFHLIEAGEMDKAKVIYAEIKDRLDAKLMSVK